VINLKVELKRLTENELELQMNWRMREDITKYLFTDPKLTLEGQLKWFNKIKNDNSQIRWTIYADDIPVGSIFLNEIDYTHKRCEIGWFIADKKVRSLELAMMLQQNMYDYIFDTLRLNRVYGYIIDTNKRVLILNTYCGFGIEGLLKEHVYKGGAFHDAHVVGLTNEIWQEKKKKFDYKRINIQ
jgi:RimJ/RimL family protein N-acetyltransferase